MSMTILLYNYVGVGMDGTPKVLRKFYNMT